MLNVAQKYALDRTAVMVTSLMNCVKIMSQQKGSELEGWNIFWRSSNYMYHLKLEKNYHTSFYISIQGFVSLESLDERGTESMMMIDVKKVFYLLCFCLEGLNIIWID